MTGRSASRLTKMIKDTFVYFNLSPLKHDGYSYIIYEKSFLKINSNKSIKDIVDKPRNKPRVPPTSPIRLWRS